MDTPLPTTCPNCNTQLAADALFCHRCGRNFTLEMSTQQMPGRPSTPGAGIPAAASQAPADPSTSATFARLRVSLADRYTLERELGRGGMATVFLAKDIKHDREVAIKVLHPELAASLGGERFEREIRLAAKLQHPHILGLYDSGAIDGLLYYVMPFVKGESLRDRLDREGMLPVDDAIRIALEVADALGYAHAQGIIHRDIKPENILLSGDHALVADFGIARAVSEAGTNKLTQTGMAVGTPVYMAPEQASAETVGPTADLYSLGCVLYEMLAGAPPFSGVTPMAIMRQHLMEQPPAVSIVRSAVPFEVENAIFAVLGKVPADRPQTAAQFAELMGMPPGSTANIRAMRMTPTASRRIPSSAQAMLAVPEPVAWWRRPQVVAVATLLLVAAAGGLWSLKGRGSRRAIDTGPEAPRLAVLYFDDRSKDQSLGPLADGLTEGLIRSLSGASNFTVISSAGAQRFRGSQAGPDSIAKALRVGYLVRGEVEPAGDQVRVSLSLDDASGAKLQSRSVTLPASSVVAMRDTLSSKVADLIRTQLGEQIRVQEQRAAASNPEAWLLLQRGQQARKEMEKAVAAKDSAVLEAAYRAADSLYAAAGARDPKWADPEAQRAALAYRRSRIAAGDPAAIRKWIALGLPRAAAALKIDPENADALEARGNLQYWGWLSNLESDPARKDALIGAAKADLEKATTINRGQAGAWATLSHLYTNYPSSTNTDVILAAQQAYQADEFLAEAETVLSRLFIAEYDLGQDDKAAQHCAEARRRFPGGYRSARCQLFLLTMKTPSPDITRAWRLADSVTAMAPPPQKALLRLNSDMLVSDVIARASKANPSLADSARHVAKRSEGDATVDPNRDLALYGAIAYTTLGDKAEAVRLLKLHFAVNPQKIAAYRDDPGWQFRDLQTDPGYRQLVGAAK